jgi:hypothetical protein
VKKRKTSEALVVEAINASIMAWRYGDGSEIEPSKRRLKRRLREFRSADSSACEYQPEKGTK